MVSKKEVKAEALRMARQAIKDELRKQGFKVCLFTAKDIDKAAYTLVYGNDELIGNCGYLGAAVTKLKRQEAKREAKVSKAEV